MTSETSLALGIFVGGVLRTALPALIGFFRPSIGSSIRIGSSAAGTPRIPRVLWLTIDLEHIEGGGVVARVPALGCVGRGADVEEATRAARVAAWEAIARGEARGEILDEVQWMEEGITSLRGGGADG